MMLSSGSRKRKTAPKPGSGDPAAAFSRKVGGARDPCGYLSSIKTTWPVVLTDGNCGSTDSRVPDHPPRPAYLKLDKWASDKKDGAQLKAGTSQTPRGQHSSRTSEVLLATLKIQG